MNMKKGAYQTVTKKIREKPPCLNMVQVSDTTGDAMKTKC